MYLQDTSNLGVEGGETSNFRNDKDRNVISDRTLHQIKLIFEGSIDLRKIIVE